MDSRQVLVLGGGVVGLSAALVLARAGHAVRLWTAEPWPDTVSAVAAAIWYPFRAYPADRVDAWSVRSYQVFGGLAADGATGVAMRSGRVLWRDPDEDPGLRLIPRQVRALPPEQVPAGYRFGAVAEVPVVEMPRYLPWLQERARAEGVRVEARRVRSVDEALGTVPLVVNCTGLGARQVAGDDTLAPIRGQVVRVANPGIQNFTLDAGENGEVITYIIPRERDVVLGGTAEPGAWERAPRTEVAAAILERCIALEPRLAAAEVLGHAVGLRPGRPEVRMQREQRATGVCIHCYGHGGSGVTASWGCAEAVAALVAGEGA